MSTSELPLDLESDSMLTINGGKAYCPRFHPDGKESERGVMKTLGKGCIYSAPTYQIEGDDRERVIET